MAGTANNQRVTSRVMGPGIIWAGLAIPAASARLTIAAVDTDGLYTPDATENPTCYALGGTKSGSVGSIKSTSQDYFIDELLAPIDRKLQMVEMSLKAELIGIADDKIATLLSRGFGTYSTSAGYKQVQIGYSVDAFTSMALIAPLREDPTKVYVFHMYKAISEGGIDINFNHKELNYTPTTFKGYAITTRALTDQLGNAWFQI